MTAGMYRCDGNTESHCEFVILSIKRSETGELCLTATHKIKNLCGAQ